MIYPETVLSIVRGILLIMAGCLGAYASNIEDTHLEQFAASLMFIIVVI